jgi:hypothetical protein
MAFCTEIEFYMENYSQLFRTEIIEVHFVSNKIASCQNEQRFLYLII